MHNEVVVANWSCNVVDSRGMVVGMCKLLALFAFSCHPAIGEVDALSLSGLHFVLLARLPPWLPRSLSDVPHSAFVSAGRVTPLALSSVAHTCSTRDQYVRQASGLRCVIFVSFHLPVLRAAVMILAYPPHVCPGFLVEQQTSSLECGLTLSMFASPVEIDSQDPRTLPSTRLLSAL